MSTFYFHVRDGDDFIEDLDGVDLPDINAAYDEAIMAAREMIAERVLSGQVIDGQVFEITDEHGRLVRSVSFKDAIKIE
jgi:hypothetical protein